MTSSSGVASRGSGSKNEDKERNIRKWFVEHDLVDGVILLPDNLFYNTPAAGTFRGTSSSAMKRNQSSDSVSVVLAATTDATAVAPSIPRS